MRVVPVPVAPLLSHQVVVHHHFVVFRVHRQNAVVSRQLCREVGEPAIVNAADGRQRQRRVRRRADIRGEYLHAGEVVGDQFAHPGNAVRRVSAGINDVRRIVGVRVAVPYRQEIVDATHQFTLRRRRKVHHGGGSSPNRPQRVFQRPGIRNPGNQLMRARLHVGRRMNVRFDTARRHDATGSIQRAVCVDWQRAGRSNGRYAPVLHRDVQHCRVVRQHDRTADYQQVHHCPTSQAILMVHSNSAHPTAQCRRA